MTSDPEVIRFCTGVEIDSELLEEAQRECDNLDLKAPEPFRVFKPDKKANEILDLVKNQSKRSVRGRSLHVTLPGTNIKYLRAPCIAIPIETQSLPKTMITQSGQNVNVNWGAEKAWEILQDVKFEDIKTGQEFEERGILLLLYLTD